MSTMSAPACLSPAPPKTNQFIRPMSPFHIVSTTQRLASSKNWFVAALEYAKAISRGQAGKFADALIVSLGNVTTMSMEDTCTIAELYMTNQCGHKVSPSMADAGGDKAAGSPATSVAQACSKRGTLSSSEDERSNNVTPLDKGIGTKPTDNDLLTKLGTIFTESARKRW